MALMERVAMLLRANVNDMIDRAEDPEKMLKQLLLDMENQLLQVKTQVAIAIADQHLLDKKRQVQADGVVHWRGKAELAVKKGEDELARLALERALSHEEMASGFRQQVAEQTTEAESLRATYTKLQGKLAETQAQCEILVAQHRRAKMAGRATKAQQVVEQGKGSLSKQASKTAVLGRLQAKIQNVEAATHAERMLLEGDSLEDKFTRLEREDKVEQLLDELKQKHGRLLPAG
jgi:phage shock protein A